MKLRILILKLIRRFIWAKRGEQWSWDRYEYVLYEIAHKKLKKLSEDSVQELINIYWLTSYGGFPENPGNIKEEFIDRVNNICSCITW